MKRALAITASPVRRISIGLVARMGLLAMSAMSAASMSQQAPSTPVVTFTFDFPQSDPAHYSIAVDATGHARFECTGKITQDSEDQTYRTEFEVSPGNRERIFDWTKRAQYFAGKVDAGNRKLAFTGAKILSYQDGTRSSTAKYNYSNVAPVHQLTVLFQDMAGTLEYGHRLAYYHRYQKLALDEELKHMETQAKNNELSEIQGVAPVLREIVEDTSVINVVRARAKELIEIGAAAAAR
jgi:hypothetical protein